MTATTPNEALHTDISGEGAAFILCQALIVAVDQVSLNLTRENDNLYVCYPVNNQLFKGKSLKTPTFAFIHENDIYTKEFEELLLHFFQENSKKESSNKNIYVQLEALVQNYLTSKIRDLLHFDITESDKDFMEKIKPVLTPTRVENLEAYLRDKEAFLPLLELSENPKEKKVLSSEFLEKFAQFLTVHTQKKYNEFNYYRNPYIEKLSKLMQGLSSKEIDICKTQLGLNDKKKFPTDKEKVFDKIMKPRLEAPIKSLNISSYSPIEIWGPCLLLSNTFQQLSCEEKKSLLYFMLMSYKINNQPHPERVQPLLLKTYCDLYQNNPELLEYKSLELMKKDLLSFNNANLLPVVESMELKMSLENRIFSVPYKTATGVQKI